MDAMHTDEESDTTRTVLELAKEHLDNWKPRQSVLHVTSELHQPRVVRKDGGTLHINVAP